MPWKARLILVLTMSSVMVAMVTLLVTYLNLGLPADFAWHWAKAYLIAWPVAAAHRLLHHAVGAPAHRPDRRAP